MVADYRAILREHWGYPDFRGIQREIIESIGAGKDTLGLMPTGGGKSITFQVPALAMEGVCLVITPLISLMKDQVDHLRRRGIRAAAIHAGMQRSDIVQTLENAVFGGVKLLYISPERLGSELFLAKLRHMRVSFVTVDEAHCISQWGYDFRPSYLEIAKIRQLLPEIPILALTATATPAVVEDIQRQLQFRTPNVYKMSFARANLSYIVRRTMDKEAELLHILRQTSGSSIVYTRSREATRELAKMLMQQGISATWYHAGLEPSVKEERQNLWQTDKVRVMVATNAFGMGIDKPNVRFVIHYNMPKDLESYYQEAGRAGRDGQPARCTLLYSGTDVRTIRFFIDKELEADNGLPADVKAEAARKAEERLKYMTFYSTTQKCLRGFLLQYFGEAAPQKCGNCSCCLAAEQEVQIRLDASHQRAGANAKRLSHNSLALSASDEKLLGKLYDVRKRLAGKWNVPAFNIFSDGVLREMTEKKPRDMDELIRLNGVGEHPAEKYGKHFLTVINREIGSRE